MLEQPITAEHVGRRVFYGSHVRTGYGTIVEVNDYKEVKVRFDEWKPDQIFSQPAARRLLELQPEDSK